MDYQVLTPADLGYPTRLKARMGEKSPRRLYHRGGLTPLSRFTMAVISADSISGVAMMAANQLLFTIRDYALNYIGGWHSVMETEIFRLGLYRSHTSVTLFSAKGLGKENYESFLFSRFNPPLDRFPERKEYFRRAESGEMPMLSLSAPDQGRTIDRNVVERNFISCMLANVVFVPYASDGTKTHAMAGRVLSAKVPVFTTDHESNGDLHLLGIPALTRQTVGAFLEKLGAKRAAPDSSGLPDTRSLIDKEFIAEPEQQWLIRDISKKDRDRGRP